ncbi:YhgE/Pip domain-containing protein [Paucisalibacillus globulus]|uniref:YhgE/Pip domain-containing protein n=1 Tax=Paucisalibacillus globulus TaxID=351095 RepID=UPI002796020F|nr:YhgE/Pip domain-containing protein [Paucisalibacillus globulus]
MDTIRNITIMGMIQMKVSFNIFLRDIKNIGTNWVALILIGGLILLPSLYAWFNIAASWDPYSQTEQIPIGIVNEDEGAIVREQEIHVGDELIETLKDNKSMGWQFVNRNEAMERLEYGDYYAVIVIPKNFSESLGTVITDNPEKAKVEYYVNEKINAIAPKITDKGASVIVDQVTRKFTVTVNGVIFEKFNEIGIELGENLPDIKKFEDYLFTLEEKLPEIHRMLNETINDANRADEMIRQAQDFIPEAEDAAAKGISIVGNANDLLNQTEQRLDEIEPKIDEDIARMQTIVTETNDFVQQLEGNLSEENSDKISGQITNSQDSLNNMEEALNELKNTEDNSNETNDTLDQAIQEIQTINDNLTNVNEQVNKITDQAAELEKLLPNLKENTSTLKTQLDNFAKDYQEVIKPNVKEKVISAKESVSRAKEVLEKVQTAIPEVSGMLNRTQDKLANGEDVLDEASNEFPYINEKVNELANRIREIQGEVDINELINLLRNDPEAEKGFFEEPVLLNENKVFSIANYGTGMTPFYTVLAIWVGALLLISLLSTDVHQARQNFTSRHVYAGRMMTFLTIGFLQTIIVTLGDMILFHVEVREPVWFVLFGMICSAIFMIIVYTLVSVFGDVGKALAIVLLVLQIAGSGGTYPVVLLPEFFQFISPLLPFTYAISLMREAVGGIIWDKAFHDLLFLGIFGLLALILGGGLKEVINKQTHKLKEKAKETGLFH